jgi:DNA invertase Pin-like site-specific DNA recombinase
MKAIVYARQSSGDEEESASIEQQISICRDYAINHGWNVTGEFSDKNTSGKTYPYLPDAINLANVDGVYQEWLQIGGKRKNYRNGLAEALKQIKNVDVIVVYDLTRLMRPLTDSYLESYIKQAILKSGVQLHSTKEGNVDFNVFSTSLVTSLESRINDNQIAITKAKSISALRKLQDNGYRYTGADFLGFKNAGRQKVTIDESEMVIVKKIISMVNHGDSYTAVCKAVNSLPEAKRTYTYNDLVKVCNRMEYAGKCINTKGEIIDSKVFPEVIPFGELLKAQNRINNKVVKNRDKGTMVHPLSGLIYCGNCGKPMVIMSSKGFCEEKTYYYKCSNLLYKNDVEAGCRGSQCRESFEQIGIKNGIKEAVLPLLLPSIEKEIREINSSTVDKTAIQIQLDKIDKLEKILDRKLVDGDITESEYEQRFDDYKKQKNSLKSELLNADVDNSAILKQLQMIAIQITLNGSINDVEYKMLAQKYIHKIVVYADWFSVTMKDGMTVNIERIRIASSRVFPVYIVSKKDKFHIKYFYKSYNADTADTAERNIIYSDDTIEVMTIGRNPAPFEYLKKRNSKKRLANCKRIY